MSGHPLLDLHCAAAPFLRGRDHKNADARARLRSAIAAVLRERGAPIPADFVASERDALDALRQLIARCADLRVSWPEIVAIVNREPSMGEDA